MEIDKTEHGWLLIACLLINGPPPDESDPELLWANAFQNRLDYRTQIMDWYCRIKGIGYDRGRGSRIQHGWPSEAQSWTSYYMAWYRNTKQEKDDV